MSIRGLMPVGLVQSGHHHYLKLTCSRHDIAETIAELALNNNHTLTHTRA